MNKLNYCIKGLICALLIFPFKMLAQDSSNSFSLEKAIEYALAHNQQIQTASLEKEIANRKVGEVLADGLPQVNADLDLGYNYQIPQVFLPANTFDPNGDPNETIAQEFGTDYNGSLGIRLEQMIFNGSYFIGLQAARTFTELSRKDHIKSKIDVAEAVSKAYYSVLISREVRSLVTKNYNRIESLLKDTESLYDGGFAEKIDVSRIKVRFNNIKVEKDHADKSVELGIALLKFQMGLPNSTSITLTDNISSVNYEGVKSDAFNNFSYANRIEYSQLETQRELNQLDIKNTNVQYVPKIDLYGSWGMNSGTQDFSELIKIGGAKWVSVGVIGIKMSVPIFDGLRKSRQIQQKKLKADQIDFSFSQLKNSIDVELKQATINYNKNRDNMLAQQENMNLAQEIYNVSQIKYKEGVGSNSEVLDADADLKQSQTNYYNALYEALIAKIDMQKALGTLLK